MPDLVSLNYWILVCLLAQLVAFSFPGVGHAAPTSTGPPPPQTSPKERLLESQKSAPMSSELLLKAESTSLGKSLGSDLPQPGVIHTSKIVYAPPMAGLHVGFLSGNTVSAETASQSPTLGVALFLDQIRPSTASLTEESLSPKTDIELNIQFDRLINLGYSRRWSLEDEDSQRPYLKVGLFNHIDSSDLIAGFVNIRHFKIRSALGFADLGKNHDKFYAEIAVSWGQTGVAGDFRLGHTLRY